MSILSSFLCVCVFFFSSISLARQCAQLWLNTRESLGHPLGVASDPVHVLKVNLAFIFIDLLSF